MKLVSELMSHPVVPINFRGLTHKIQNKYGPTSTIR